jgi:hypothetical protein
MSERDRRDRSDFDRAFGAWGRRGPRTSPEAASRRVAELVAAPRTVQRRPRLSWVAATILVAAVGTWYVVRNGGDLPPPIAPPPEVADFATLPLDDNVVLWWLDKETPVYFVLKSPKDEETEDDDPKSR